MTKAIKGEAELAGFPKGFKPSDIGLKNAPKISAKAKPAKGAKSEKAIKSPPSRNVRYPKGVKTPKSATPKEKGRKVPMY